MRAKRLFEVGAAAVLSISAVLLIASPAAFAAPAKTCTWTGAGADENFNTAANWDAACGDGTTPAAPIATDDDNLIFSNNGTSQIPVNNIAGLTVNNITWTGNPGSGTGASILDFTVPVTVTGNLTQDSSVTTVEDTVEGTVALGADVSVEAGVNFNKASGVGSIALGGHTLTFVDGNDSGQIEVYRVPITGAGTVTFNMPNNDAQIYNASTYSGTTNINGVNGLLADNGVSLSQIFGSSTINIGSTVFLTVSVIDADNNTTINNPINIAGSTSGFSGSNFGSGLQFNCDSSEGCTAPPSVAIPHITLNGNSRMSEQGNVTVDLAGITTNNYCLEYGIFNGGSSSSSGGYVTDGSVPANFKNGPSSCTVTQAAASTTAPTVPTPAKPDTGLAAITAHPIVTLLTSVAAAGALMVIARRMKPATSK